QALVVLDHNHLQVQVWLGFSLNELGELSDAFHKELHLLWAPQGRCGVDARKHGKTLPLIGRAVMLGNGPGSSELLIRSPSQGENVLAAHVLQPVQLTGKEPGA